MNTGTITISGIETKEGTSQAGKPWRLFKIVSETGVKYSTFDGGIGQKASGAVGRQAAITYETTDKGNDLKSLTVTDGEPVRADPPPFVPPTAPPAQRPNGDTDWDLIGLRKTRCALWAAVLSNADLNQIPAQTVAAFARELVLAAEVDIFTRPAADNTDDIPF